jgi:hypothetical protein
MFPTGAEVWRGLARNAHEALGSPWLIGPSTVILFGGQVLPICALAAVLLGGSASPIVFALSLFGTVASFLPRMLAIARFRQSLRGQYFILGVCFLIQYSLFSFRRGTAVWRAKSKGRRKDETALEP